MMLVLAWRVTFNFLDIGYGAAIANILFLLMFLLALAYVRTNSLWLPIGLHFGWNLFEGPVFGFPVSGIATPVLIEQRVQGPDIWTGGAFGPEAGLVQIASLGVGFATLWLYTRRRAPPSAPSPPPVPVV